MVELNLDPQARADLRHNLVVNLLDGSFFGFALGFASFVTIIPLFVSQLTDSAVLIGLIPAIHSMGWQLPQLLTADHISRQRRFRPFVLLATIHERLPFFGLSLVALALPALEKGAALVITYALLVWQGLGGGFAAAAWQSLIAKIIPPTRRGTFYGLQSACANGMSALGAVLAGIILDRAPSPLNFSLCFLLAAIFMCVSWYFLSRTREQEIEPVTAAPNRRAFWRGLRDILRRDGNFRGFLVVRMLSQFAVMAASFYTVYAVERFQVTAVTVGWLTSLLLGIQIFSNPVMGWVGDRWGHRIVMEAGLLCAIASALLAWWAPAPVWFFPVFGLAGIANVAVWTISMAMILDFGPDEERTAYIGLANTLVAPATFLAPLLGGWLANLGGYPSAFIASAFGGLVCALVLHLVVKNPPRARSLPNAAEGQEIPQVQ